MSGIYPKRVMLAAPCSGSGKTTVTCALLEVLKSRGLDPVSYKCGPDYIDPLFHKKVLGIESRNLDVYFEGEDGIRDIISSCGEGYAVAEGVMGIYDGIYPDSQAGSCYEIAELSETPVILTVNASGTGRTVISLVRGVLSDDTSRLIKGIIMNRMSRSFYDLLKPVFDKEISSFRDDVRLLGFMPECRDISVESRHLGLKLPYEIDDIKAKVRKAASLLEETVDIGAVLSIMEKAPHQTADKASDHKEKNEKALSDTGEGLTLAVAYDDAFCFYYRDNLDIFEEHGVRTVFFSPLKDREIPEEADGLLFGGGYPEEHLLELSDNRTMLDSVKRAINKGMPSLAECGGFMYLHRTVRDIKGRSFEMAGVIDGECAYSGHLVRFGYMRLKRVNVPYASDELYRSLAGIKGHEFHYYDSSCSGEACIAEKPSGSRSWECMTVNKNGIWGFPHFYYRSAPSFITEFVKRMRSVKNSG